MTTRHPLPIRDRRAVDAIRSMVKSASATEECLAVGARAFVIAREHGLSRARAQHLSRRAAELHREGDNAAPLEVTPGEVFSRQCPSCGWAARLVVDDGSCRICKASLGPATEGGR